ncbi:MAG: 4-(cytidine 5'-diphospho)-2-C-methyl-D-erythritol kinase [Nitrospiraceae bacterium]|nr:4-(cytidine 5'-diphospho)-2-C-methyl-D-erythritol kinase [Nitrospiraceae bacterium]
MNSLTLLVPAKINLFLLIQGRRPDGYHLIFTLFQKISLWDELALSIGRGKGEIHLECPGTNLSSGPQNLAYRASTLFLKETGLDLQIKIVLKKTIPVGGGLGGGSSDAASVLKGLNELAGFPLDQPGLHSLASSLGADVPFFLLEAPAAIGRGIGTELEVISTPHRWYVLVYPGFSVSTRWAYRQYLLTSPNGDTTFGIDKTIEAAMWQNDLERLVILRYPEIAEIKAELMSSGAEAALMSGSGSTVFGAFSSKADALIAVSSLETKGLNLSLVESL